MPDWKEPWGLALVNFGDGIGLIICDCKARGQRHGFYRCRRRREQDERCGGGLVWSWDGGGAGEHGEAHSLEDSKAAVKYKKRQGAASLNLKLLAGKEPTI
ncbi:hypothetical protein M0R45_019093 [Rubus argutus]|uniref:Uncharacterized protein n=1 Tax=Rubus argutus TaxID=59490 RepID=A0AAW1X690_RUBAR